MKYFVARKFYHASEDGRETLCGLFIYKSASDGRIWHETPEEDLELSTMEMCPRCRFKIGTFGKRMLSGIQKTL